MSTHRKGSVDALGVPSEQPHDLILPEGDGKIAQPLDCVLGGSGEVLLDLTDLAPLELGQLSSAKYESAVVKCAFDKPRIINLDAAMIERISSNFSHGRTSFNSDSSSISQGVAA